MKRNILVYEPCIGNVPYLTFVLNMAQMGCTHARTAEEALNWLEAAALKVISFDFVMISSLCADKLEGEFLKRMSDLDVEVVFLQRDDVPSMALEGYSVCHPDHLLDWLNSDWNDRDKGFESLKRSPKYLEEHNRQEASDDKR